MRRLRLVVEYDGTAFCGFQRQREVRSVQGVLEQRLQELCGHPVEITGAGRTDAGVHALGQVVHFDTKGRIPVERLAQAFNSAPQMEDVVVRYAEEAPPDFHARFGARRRTYRYYVLRKQPSPFVARYVIPALGLAEDAAERMREALRPLVGRHDFAAFQATGSVVHTTVRTLERAEIGERGALLWVELTADAFLRSMVRIVTGLALEIGRGRLEPDVLEKALRSGKRPAGVAAAPPQGLFLTRVDYPDGFPAPELLASEPEWLKF